MNSVSKTMVALGVPQYVTFRWTCRDSTTHELKDPYSIETIELYEVARIGNTLSSPTLAFIAGGSERRALWRLSDYGIVAFDLSSIGTQYEAKRLFGATEHGFFDDALWIQHADNGISYVETHEAADIVSIDVNSAGVPIASLLAAPQAAKRQFPETLYWSYAKMNRRHPVITHSMTGTFAIELNIRSTIRNIGDYFLVVYVREKKGGMLDRLVFRFSVVTDPMSNKDRKITQYPTREGQKSWADFFRNKIPEFYFWEDMDPDGITEKTIQLFSGVLWDGQMLVDAWFDMRDPGKSQWHILPVISLSLGWALQSSRVSSWRKQIFSIADLWKKKGTLAGLREAIEVCNCDLNSVDFYNQVRSRYFHTDAFVFANAIEKEYVGEINGVAVYNPVFRLSKTPAWAKLMFLPGSTAPDLSDVRFDIRGDGDKAWRNVTAMRKFVVVGQDENNNWTDTVKLLAYGTDSSGSVVKNFTQLALTEFNEFKITYPFEHWIDRIQEQSYLCASNSDSARMNPVDSVAIVNEPSSSLVENEFNQPTSSFHAYTSAPVVIDAVQDKRFSKQISVKYDGSPEAYEQIEWVDESGEHVGIRLYPEIPVRVPPIGVWKQLQSGLWAFVQTDLLAQISVTASDGISYIIDTPRWFFSNTRGLFLAMPQQDGEYPVAAGSVINTGFAFAGASVKLGCWPNVAASRLSSAFIQTTEPNQRLDFGVPYVKPTIDVSNANLSMQHIYDEPLCDWEEIQKTEAAENKECDAAYIGTSGSIDIALASSSIVDNGVSFDSILVPPSVDSDADPAVLSGHFLQTGSYSAGIVAHAGDTQTPIVFLKLREEMATYIVDYRLPGVLVYVDENNPSAVRVDSGCVIYGGEIIRAQLLSHVNVAPSAGVNVAIVQLNLADGKTSVKYGSVVAVGDVPSYPDPDPGCIDIARLFSPTEPNNRPGHDGTLRQQDVILRIGYARPIDDNDPDYLGCTALTPTSVTVSMNTMVYAWPLVYGSFQQSENVVTAAAWYVQPLALDSYTTLYRAVNFGMPGSWKVKVAPLVGDEYLVPANGDGSPLQWYKRECVQHATPVVLTVGSPVFDNVSGGALSPGDIVTYTYRLYDLNGGRGFVGQAVLSETVPDGMNDMTFTVQNSGSDIPYFLRVFININGEDAYCAHDFQCSGLDVFTFRFSERFALRSLRGIEPDDSTANMLFFSVAWSESDAWPMPPEGAWLVLTYPMRNAFWLRYSWSNNSRRTASGSMEPLAATNAMAHISLRWDLWSKLLYEDGRGVLVVDQDELVKLAILDGAMTSDKASDSLSSRFIAMMPVFRYDSANIVLDGSGWTDWASNQPKCALGYDPLSDSRYAITVSDKYAASVKTDVVWISPYVLSYGLSSQRQLLSLKVNWPFMGDSDSVSVCWVTARTGDLQAILDAVLYGQRPTALNDSLFITDPQWLEAYIMTLPLADTQDQRDLYTYKEWRRQLENGITSPVSNPCPAVDWNTRLIHRDDTAYKLICPEMPYPDDVVFGYLRTQMPYGSTVYGVDQYDGSTRPSDDPSDIDVSFIEPCACSPASHFGVNVTSLISDESDVSDDELKGIVEEMVPMHSRLRFYTSRKRARVVLYAMASISMNVKRLGNASAVALHMRSTTDLDTNNITRGDIAYAHERGEGSGTQRALASSHDATISLPVTGEERELWRFDLSGAYMLENWLFDRINADHAFPPSPDYMNAKMIWVLGHEAGGSVIPYAPHGQGNVWKTYRVDPLWISAHPYADFVSYEAIRADIALMTHDTGGASVIRKNEYAMLSINGYAFDSVSLKPGLFIEIYESGKTPRRGRLIAIGENNSLIIQPTAPIADFISRTPGSTFGIALLSTTDLKPMRLIFPTADSWSRDRRVPRQEALTALGLPAGTDGTKYIVIDNASGHGQSWFSVNMSTYAAYEMYHSIFAAYEIKRGDLLIPREGYDADFSTRYKIVSIDAERRKIMFEQIAGAEIDLSLRITDTAIDNIALFRHIRLIERPMRAERTVAAFTIADSGAGTIIADMKADPDVYDRYKDTLRFQIDLGGTLRGFKFTIDDIAATPVYCHTDFGSYELYCEMLSGGGAADGAVITYDLQDIPYQGALPGMIMRDWYYTRDSDFSRAMMNLGGISGVQGGFNPAASESTVTVNITVKNRFTGVQETLFIV